MASRAAPSSLSHSDVAPAELFDCPNVVLTPHVAARSPEAIDASVRQFQENSRLHFAGEPVLTPVG